MTMIFTVQRDSHGRVSPAGKSGRVTRSGVPGVIQVTCGAQFVCLFAWCLTAHQHKKAISAKNR